MKQQKANTGKNALIFISILAVVLVSFFSSSKNKVSAETTFDTSDKDDVLINVNTAGTAYGQDLLWKQPYTGTSDEFGGVIVENDIGYVASKIYPGFQGTGMITAFHIEDGSVIWQTYIGSSDGTPMIDNIDNNVIWINTCLEGIDGIYKLNKTTGEVLCSQTAGSDGIAISLAQSDTMVYGGGLYHNEFHAFNKSNCSVAWTYTVSGASGVMTTPLYYNNTVTFGAIGGTNNFIQLNATTGALNWVKGGGNTWDMQPSIKDGIIYMGSKAGNYIAAFDFATGDILWSRTSGVGNGTLTQMAIYDNKLWFGATDGKIYGLDITNNGSTVCSSTVTSGRISQGPSIVEDELGNGYAFYGSAYSSNHYIYMMKTSDCSVVWSYNTVAMVYSPPAIARGKIYVAVDDWNVYAFDIGTGTEEWKNIGYSSLGHSFCPDCLTSWKKVASTCSTVGATSTCNVANSYLGRAIETKMKMASTIASATLPSGDKHIYVDGTTVYLPKIASLESITGMQITTGAAYDPTLPKLSGVTPATANVLEASYNTSTESMSLSFDNTSTIAANISLYKRPFSNVTSTITSAGATSISATGLTGTTDVDSVNMEVTPSSDSVDVAIDTWDTSGTYYKKWTESSTAVIASTNHVVGNLQPNTNYPVRINGTVFGTYLSNGSGEITFAYDGGYSTKTFEIGNTPAAPTIDIPSVLSSSSIDWNFTDNAGDEAGFKLYDDLNNLISTVATANISSISESGLSENTQYTRNIKAYNGYADSVASDNASFYTLADTPSHLAVNSISPDKNDVSVDLLPNDSAGSSGYYFSSSSGNNSGWISTNSWRDTGLICGVQYTYSVKYRNGDGIETDVDSLVDLNPCVAANIGTSLSSSVSSLLTSISQLLNVTTDASSSVDSIDVDAGGLANDIPNDINGNINDTINSNIGNNSGNNVKQENRSKWVWTVSIISTSLVGLFLLSKNKFLG